MFKFSLEILLVVLLINWSYGASVQIDESDEENQASNNLNSENSKLQNELNEIDEVLNIELEYLKKHGFSNLKESRMIVKELLAKILHKYNDDNSNVEKLQKKRFNENYELEFCSECFLKQDASEECLYCYSKYIYKTSKRTKPSSKYWYSRAGRR